MPSTANEAPRGHFLTIIARDGQVLCSTVDCMLSAELDAFRDIIPLSGKVLDNTASKAERQALRLALGRGLFWRGWKFHAGEGHVRSRNECAHRFLHNTNCQFHDSLDADIKFRADHWRALRDHPEAENSVIIGLYPKKMERIEHCFNTLKDQPFNPDPKTGLGECAKGGTGFSQVPRKIYAAIMEAHPEWWYDCDFDIGADGKRERKFGFFQEVVAHDADLDITRLQTEDWFFCHTVRHLGFKIYADVRTATMNPPIEHVGPAVFPLSSELERLKLEAEIKDLRAQFSALQKQFGVAPANELTAQTLAP